ncbi:hypothetical protein RND81_01G191400 [Saponaria officinalis]|uniref:Uncharacterized protein n=1 Tax=Saponaria officinalis TaxID=3572 RepID=A0AAW1NGE4_SAPOF
MGLNCNIGWYAITLWFIILKKSCFTTFSLTIHNTSIVNTNIDPSLLDDYLYKYSSRSISKNHHTGVLFHVSLPSNFSGITMSIVWLRRSTIWSKGANFSTIEIPPKVIKMQHVKRFALMYENFGNMSSHYFDLPGYEILSSIIGFTVYNATDLSQTTNPQKLNVNVSGEPIKVKFPDNQVKLSKEKNLNNIKCVKIDPVNGLIVLSNIIRSNICLTRSIGLFAIAMPRVNVSDSTPTPAPTPALHVSSHRKGVKFAIWKRWLIGFIVGIMALILLISGCVICYKTIRLMKIAKMERKAEKSESLNTMWIGTSKMPLAHVTRTQAVLENDLAP